MEEYLYQIAEKIDQINQQAYVTYLPMFDDICNKKVSEDKLSQFLDYLLDFAYDEKMLELYKRVCKNYLYTYPECIKFYIEAYREMWEEM